MYEDSLALVSPVLVVILAIIYYFLVAKAANDSCRLISLTTSNSIENNEGQPYIMDSEISVPRLIAPRPLFMEPWECDEYAEIHEFIRERHDKNVNETKVHCRFYNISERDVDVIWCRGKEEEDYIYATVPPKRFFKILTFEGHPWIFRATEDGDRMAIHPTNATVHYPHRATCTKINSENGPLSIQFVFIKSRGVESTIDLLNSLTSLLPERTLKQLAIRTLGRHFKTDKILAENLPPDIMVFLYLPHIE